jgi:hypothetical protein
MHEGHSLLPRYRDTLTKGDGAIEARDHDSNARERIPELLPMARPVLALEYVFTASRGKLQFIELLINTTEPDQLFVATSLHDSPVIHDDDHVRVQNRR